MNMPGYRHHEHTVGRAAFYAVACDPQRNVVVEACAGAGKTWMLVSRILRALMLRKTAPDGSIAPALEPQEILAITFSKKAAGEMRQRLQDFLQTFANAPEDVLDQALLQRGIAPERLLNERIVLSNLYREVLATGRSVNICTMHAWFAQLLRSAPLAVLAQLGLPLNYQLLEDDAQAVASLWPRFYAALLKQPEARTAFDALVAAQGRHQAKQALENALAQRVAFALADAQGAVDSAVPSAGEWFAEMAGFARPEDWFMAAANQATLLAAAKLLGQAKAPTYAQCGSQLEQAITSRNADAAIAAVLTQKGEPRKFNAALFQSAEVQAAQALALRLLAARIQHAAWQHQQQMALLTRVLLHEYGEHKRARGWVDMQDLELAALHLLSDPLLSGWVQERLDARVRHVLIDEFQDTSPLQWQVLREWLSAYAGAGSGAPSVFIVGDPKQSIYRFRGAAPQVFEAAKSFVIEGLGGDLLQCDHTHRNAPAVLAVVNQVMQVAQEAEHFNGFRRHSTESQAIGEVLSLPQIDRPEISKAAPEAAAQVWRSSLAAPREEAEEHLKTLECRQAAQWLAAHLQRTGLQPGDVMVLSRKRDHLRRMESELRRLSIPAQPSEKTALADMPEVQDVVCLLDALVSPSHDLSLAQALKSPLFGLGDDDLAALAVLQRQARAESPGKPQSWFYLLLNSKQLPHSMQGLAVTLMQYRAWVQGLPPHDALAAMYHHSDALARYGAAAPPELQRRVVANLQALLHAALDLNGGRYATPYALVRALKAGGVQAPPVLQEDAVRLLTIHGAKGLQAPLVLLLDAAAVPPRAASMGVLIDWPGEAAAPQQLIFLQSESAPPPSASAVLAAERAAREREEMNALYVAMTRASRQLVVSSVQPKLVQERSWQLQLQPHCQPVPEVALAALQAGSRLESPKTGTSATIETVFLMPNLPGMQQGLAGAATENEVAFNGLESTEGSRQTDAPAAALGQALHRLLEWWQPGQNRASSSQLQRAAAEFGLDSAQAHAAHQLAQNIVHGQGAWAWQAAHLRWSGNEVPLVFEGQWLRLDRLVQRADTGCWWVLDYKSAAQPQQQVALRAQMQRYRSAVQAAYPGEAVRAAFLAGDGSLLEVAELGSPSLAGQAPV